MGAMVLDTQEIVSLSRKGKPPPDGDVFITSTTAQELFFLRVRGSGKPAYWIPALHKVRRAELMERKDWRLLVKEYSSRGAAHRDRHLDRLVADFGRDYPPIVETGHAAIARIVNERKGWLFPMCADAGGLKFLREMRSRADYLDEHRIRCKPLNGEAMNSALPMFHAFVGTYAVKLDYRNSLNDIFILSVANSWRASLLTSDRLLANFSKNYLGAEVEDFQGCGKINFPVNFRETQKMRESKMYVNKNWRMIADLRRRGLG